MEIWDTVCSIASKACAIVANMATKIGNTLSNATSVFLETLKKLPLKPEIVSAVFTVIEIIATIYSWLKEDESPAKIGAKAMKAEKKLEDFDSTREYIEYLRNEIHIDEDELKNATKETKLVRQAIGSVVILKALKEEKNMDLSIDTLITLAKLRFDQKKEEIKKMFETFGPDINDIDSYAKGKLDENKEIEVGDKLVKLYKELYPELSEEEIERKVMDMKVE